MKKKKKKRARKLTLKLRFVGPYFCFVYVKTRGPFGKEILMSSISWKNYISGEAKLSMKRYLNK